ncbi:MAG TPA: response regulator [Terriglobia bacterium]|nr:response regulator [Terriglobia bacterium]
MAEILVVVEDLIFLAKIQQTAKLLGIAVETVSPDLLEARVAEGSVRVVVLDLNHRSGQALETLRALKANLQTSSIPVIGFLSHVQTELVEAARATGCDIVLARSAFSRDLPQLLEQYGGA